MGTKMKLGALVPFLLFCLLKAQSASAVPSQKMGNITFECPNGFEIRGPYCYLLVDLAVDLNTAVNTCNRYGTDLINIVDEVEAKTVSEMVSSIYPEWDIYWIGNVMKENTDLCSGFWDTLEPVNAPSTNGFHLSVAVTSGGRWQLKHTWKGKRYPFVCKTEACVEGTFRCSYDGKCISSNWTCDGVYDCDGQSDESDCESECTYYIHQESGTLTKNQYDPGKTCTWVIEGAVGKPLSITFESLDVEQDMDYVEVLFGTRSEREWELEATLTGKLTNRTVYGFDHFLIVRLVADMTVQGKGFVARWRPDDELSSQERVVVATDAWTELTSPYYYSDHPPSSYVRHYTVTTEPGSVITMEVMESGVSDDPDHFEYDPDTLSNINGEHIFPDTFVSTSNTFSFFLASEYWEKANFQARVKKGCAVNVTRSNGFILPPNMEDKSRYPPSLTCDYIINAPPGALRTFKLSFSQFNLADGKDFVKIFDGPDNGSEELSPSGGYTGSNPPNGDAVFVSSFSSVYVQFFSSLVQTDGFFQLDFNLACPPVSNTDNMTVSSNDTDYGSVVTLSCNGGFAFAQEEHVNQAAINISCGKDGKWNVTRMPTCAEIYCGVPQSIPNGFIAEGSGNARYGATVTYQCYEGFNLTGSNSSTCGDGSSWTTIPTCETLECILLPSLPNGNSTFISGEGTDFGSIAQFSCNEGYDLIGSRFSVCRKDGVWSHPTPLCQAIKCPIPDVDRSITKLNSDVPVEFPASLEVTCSEGYVINGTSLNSKNYTCPHSGDFRITYDVCVDFDECDSTNMCSAANHEQCMNTIGSYTCDCVDKFQRIGSNCEAINRCDEETSGCDLTSGNCTALGYGEDYMCQCNPGYTLFTEDGTSGRYIPPSEDGDKLGDVFYLNHTCVPKTCSLEFGISNGRALTNKTSFDFGESVKIRCDFGYELSSNTSDNLTCSGDNVWDPPPPTCERMTCDPLAPTGLVLNIFPNMTTYPGDMVLLECNSESTDKPYNKTLFCAYDNETNAFRLQGDSPLCPAIDCGVLNSFGGTNIDQPSSNGLGSSFHFRCAAGFTKEGISINGNDTVVCGKNGRWGFGNLTCIGERCTDPGTPAGMNLTVTKFEVGGNVTYYCDRPGFMPSPLSPFTRTCIFNSTSNSSSWNGDEPVCSDEEYPSFNNCPSQPVKVKLYNKPEIDAASLNATDNSGLVKLTVSPKWFIGNVSLDHGTQNVVFTATDAAGLHVDCPVTLEVHDPADLPYLECPEYLALDVNGTSYSIDLNDHVNTTDEDSTLSFSPGSIVSVEPGTVGKTAYRVTATDQFGFQRQCAFVVDIKPSICQSAYINSNISSKNAEVNCDNSAAGTLNCTVTCNNGFAFQNGLTSMPYNCQGTNDWTPSLPARSCVATQNTLYKYAVDVMYTTSAFVITDCTNFLKDRLKERIPQQNVSGCAVNQDDTVNFEVFSVEFPFTDVLNLTARIHLVTSSSTLSPKACASQLENESETGQLFNVSDTPFTCKGLTGVISSRTQTLYEHDHFCQTGLIVASIGGTEKCVHCEPGFYFNGSQCVECQNGQYQDLEGQTECKPCPDGGVFSNQPRLSSSQCVAPCLPGFYNNQTHSPMPADCIACPEDTYLDTAYTALCVPCNDDKSTFGYEGAVLQNQCIDKCAAGQYPVHNKICEACPRGYYKDTPGNSACTPCGMNETTKETGATSSDQCEPDTASLTCMNGGTSSFDYHINFCDCPDGYSGKTCEIPVNPCDSSPCYNGGKCTPSSDSYSCDCPVEEKCNMVENTLKFQPDRLDTYFGVDSETCKEKCLDNAMCAAILYLPSNSFCLLYNATQYQNGSSSTGDGFLKSCERTKLFEGDRCEVNLQKNCTNDTCADQSFCRDFVGGSECVCPSESKYRQPSCEEDLDVCSNACQNSATCLDSGNGIRATCICPPGYTGNKCEINIDECAANPHGCLYGGKCIDAVNGYTCDCLPNFTGEHCEEKPDFCSIQNVCANGLCYNDYNTSSAVCVCEFPYRLGSDNNCEEIDICKEDNPCQHNSTCTREGPGQTSCQCQPGYNGSLCQHNIDDCSPHPCGDHGQCDDMVENYTCRCNPGYEGFNCENNTDDCLSHNCTANNTARCEDLLQDFKCVCNVGFTGKYCETNIDECLSLPCLHNGTCEQSVTPGQYTCTCQDGWTGDNCESLPQFCGNNTCNNSADCLSLQDDFFCNCSSGTFGKTCETGSKLCDILNPCTPESTCVADGGTARCECPKNYTGSSCNLNKDSCSEGPCQKGGTCISLALGYKCQCKDGYSGERCTEEADPCETADCPSGTCNVEDGKAFCVCGANQVKSGSTCKVLSNDFDIYFQKKRYRMIQSHQPFRLTAPSLSVMVWIAPLSRVENTLLELESSSGESYFSVAGDNVKLGKDTVPMKDTTGKTEPVVEKWNQLIVTWENSTGNYDIFLNGIRLSGGTTSATFPPQNELILIKIGRSFEGYISQLYVWQTVLTFMDSLTMYQDPSNQEKADHLVARWGSYSLSDNHWVKLVSPSTVQRARTMCAAGVSGDNICPMPDKEPIELTECPGDKMYYDVDRLVQIGDSFHYEGARSNLERTVLTFGAHRVVFVVKDNQTNVAFCRFTAYVQRTNQSCSNTEGLNPEYIANCEDRGRKVQCPAGSKAPLSPMMLTCGKLGSYNLDISHQLPPAIVCGNTTSAQLRLTLTLAYQLGISCVTYYEPVIQEALKQKVETLRANWTGLCPESNCSNAVVTAKCQSPTSLIVTATIELSDQPLSITKQSANVTLTSKELLQTASLELDSFAIMNNYNAKLLKDSVAIAEDQHCEAGFGLFDDTCVMCAEGSFLNETTKKCELCPIGTYTNSFKEPECMQCPDGQTTLQLGSSSCKPKCDPGQHLDENDQCQDCAKNFYQDQPGQRLCLPCPAGTASESTGSDSVDLCFDTCSPGTELKNSSCVPCPRGYFRDGVTDSQEACEKCPSVNTTAGTGSTSRSQCDQTACSSGYLRNSTSNQCQECDYGYFQPDKWQDQCEKCNDSYTTEDKGSVRADQCRFVCPAGQENLAGTSCTPCERGYYRNDSLAHRFLNCTPCDSEFTTSGTGSQVVGDCNIRVCKAGSYREEANNTCYECPVGKYQPDDLQIDCLLCPANTTTKQTGSVNKSQCLFFCPPGYEVLSADNRTCRACARGYYKDKTDTFGMCQICPDNSTTDTEASEDVSSCQFPKCDAGQEIKNSGCSDCSENKYQPKNMPRSSDTCTLCPEGTGTKAPKQTSVEACLPVCGPGKQHDNGSSACVPCPMGTWNSGNDSQRFEQCAPCPSGYVTDNEMTGANSTNQCNLKDCSAGEYISGSDCVVCPIGQFQDSPRQASCNSCPINTNTSGNNPENHDEESDCTVYCPAGQTQGAGESNCTLCDPDTFKASAGYGTCQNCTGNYTSDENRTACNTLFCDEGFEHDGKDDCSPCEEGKYKESRGNDNLCIPCPTNSTTPGKASTSQAECTVAYCDQGFYSLNGSLPCLPCPVGQYKNTTGNNNCTACSANTTEGVASTAANDCSVVVCPAGQFRIEETNKCENCPIGQYQDEGGQSSCKTCQNGYNTTGVQSERLDDCRIVCPAGQFRIDSTNTCMNCSRGWYQDAAGEASCKECATNYTTSDEGSTKETDCFIVCPVGKYATSRTSCMACPHGQFQSSSGSSSCENCSQGETTLQTESSSDDDCMPICGKGQYLNTTLKKCIVCDLGSYNPEAGSMTTAVKSCQNCPDGRTTASNGSVSQSDCNVEDCGPGFYRSPDVGCQECWLGSYQPEKSQDHCKDCPSGNTTLITGAVSELKCVRDCPDGHEFNFEKSDCEECALVYYRNKSVGLKCRKCPEGYTTLKAGENSCVQNIGDDLPPQAPKIIKMTVRLLLIIGECDNKILIKNTIEEFIKRVLLRTNQSYRGICSGPFGECSNLEIVFKEGCLENIARRKRNTDGDQTVELNLNGVSDEVQSNETGNVISYQTVPVVRDAFYNVQPEQFLLDTRKITFSGVTNSNYTTQCQPGQKSTTTDCEACPEGEYSTDGISCLPCEQNSYQDSKGQSSCLSCPHNTYTAASGSTHIANCTKKCDEPNASQTYCSGRGACVFDARSSEGVRCNCDDNYSGDSCESRKISSDDKTKMIAGIAGGVGGFLLLLLLMVGIVACLRRAANKGKKATSGMGPIYSGDAANISYPEDGMSDRYMDYNFPLYDNGVRGYANRPAIMYMNPAADQDVRDFYTNDKGSNPPSRTRSRSYESEWRDFDGVM